MTSNTDYKMHGVDGPHEISKQAPLSDRKHRREKLPSKRKQRRRGKTGGPGAGHAGARPADQDVDLQEAADSAPESTDDHAVDHYA